MGRTLHKNNTLEKGKTHMADTAAQALASKSAHQESVFKNLTEYCHSFKGADVRRALFQVLTTTALFFTALGAMFFSLEHQAYWLYALLLLPTAGCLIRLFIIQHDCGHGSFFHGKAANNLTGRLISILTFIPYDLWRRAHNMHHAGSGNLDRRGAGDVDTLTVREYQALSEKNKFLYRLYRNPLVLLLFGPPVYFIIMLRFPPMQKVPFSQNYHPLPVAGSWRSTMSLNALLVAFYGTLGLLVGWNFVLAVYLPVVVITGLIGQWLFFIQHQYENAYWQGGKNWNYAQAAIQGSSYYALPRVLQWFTGNIGFHHIHHLCPAIPNYRLQECFDGNKDLANISRLTFTESLKCIWLALWDEDRQKMIRFKDLATAAV